MTEIFVRKINAMVAMRMHSLWARRRAWASGPAFQRGV